MGQRQVFLNQILLQIDSSTLKIDKPNFVKSDYNLELFKQYKLLGGLNSDYPKRIGGFDISRSQYIIELDEERHFNRYRLITLASTVYKDLLTFDIDKYKLYCNNFENNCFKAASWGGNWQNNSTEKQFGKSDPNGIINKLGSSRWKQRAYYDFLKDTFGIIQGIPIIRLSIYDKIDDITSIDLCLKQKKIDKLLYFLDKKIKMRIT